MSWVDENAFGILISYFGIEDDEYGLEREQFVERFLGFRRIVTRYAEGCRVGSGARVVNLGHAWYFEIAEGEQCGDPLGWLKGLRAALGEDDYTSFGVLSYGGRWTESGSETKRPEDSIRMALNPSEPLRRALYADTAAQHSDSGLEDGWGAGLYVDAEAIEALGRALKNMPTGLSVAGATFYRVAR